VSEPITEGYLQSLQDDWESRDAREKSNYVYIPSLVAEIRRLRAELQQESVESISLKILIRITKQLNLKPGEDPEWEQVGKWIALGRAVEEMPTYSSLSHGVARGHWSHHNRKKQRKWGAKSPLEALTKAKEEA
jgi:hypothetical protein